jgi:hypothetical protein
MCSYIPNLVVTSHIRVGVEVQKPHEKEFQCFCILSVQHLPQSMQTCCLEIDFNHREVSKCTLHIPKILAYTHCINHIQVTDSLRNNVHTSPRKSL